MATSTGRYGGGMEMRHSRSEDLLGVISGSRSPSPAVALATTASEDDLIAATALHEVQHSPAPSTCPLLPSTLNGPQGVPPDRIDPEDSIRDIVTENDLYRFVTNIPYFSCSSPAAVLLRDAAAPFYAYIFASVMRSSIFINRGNRGNRHVRRLVFKCAITYLVRKCSILILFLRDSLVIDMPPSKFRLIDCLFSA